MVSFCRNLLGSHRSCSLWQWARAAHCTQTAGVRPTTSSASKKLTERPLSESYGELARELVTGNSDPPRKRLLLPQMFVSFNEEGFEAMVSFYGNLRLLTQIMMYQMQW